MPKLSSSVGRSSPNRPHDVALIQAALASLPTSPNSPFGQKIWTRPVDGRASPDLERAITLFQSNNRIIQSGRIDPMGPDIQALDRGLPPDCKGIAVVENCTAVLCSSMNVSSMNQAQEALRKRTLLPGPAAEQLGDVVRNIQKQMGLVLRPDGHGIDQQGRMVQKLAFADTHWMNNSGQFTPQIPMDKAQQVVSALLRRPLPSLLEWHTGPMPFDHGPVHQSQRVGNMIGASGGGMGTVVLAIRVKQGLRCLSGMNRPIDNQRLQRVGLRATNDPVADRMQDVAATEIEAGNAGANELGIISDIFKGLFDGASNGIQKAQARSTGPSPFEDAVDELLRITSGNYNSPQFRHLKSVVSDPIRRPEAYAEFRTLVANRKPWDIKRVFSQWVHDPIGGFEYGRDIWGNVHYGYLGRAAGFLEFELLNAAGWAQYLAHVNNNPSKLEMAGVAIRELIHSWDDPKDQEAIRLGMKLWDLHPYPISRQVLLDELRRRRTQLNTK